MIYVNDHLSYYPAIQEEAGFNQFVAQTVSYILHGKCISVTQDILKNLIYQDALSGTGHTVYSFALMFRLWCALMCCLGYKHT